MTAFVLTTCGLLLALSGTAVVATAAALAISYFYSLIAKLLRDARRYRED